MTTKDDVVKHAEANHIWLNAFKCINPTDEFLIGIGRTVVEMLNRRDNLLPKYIDLDGTESERAVEALQSLAKLTPILYMSVNKS